MSLAKFAPTADPVALTLGQSLTVSLVLAPFATDAPATLRAFDAAAWGRFAYLAIAGSTLAPLFQVAAQSRLSAGRIALLFALEPVFALVCALTFGAERFEARWWFGALLILSAVVLVEWKAATSTSSPASR
ncbi:MAG: DMT family transporter [Candidatus Eisenbacteria bacterium]